jgi:glycosyltransferase involved in cell wall biosynthesis
MKISMINSFYSRSKPSGENELFDQLHRGLLDIGVHASPITLETDVEELKVFFRLRSALNVAIGRGGKNPTTSIESDKPDLVHVNNLFPNFSSSWIGKTDKPKIISIHNYRVICAAGTLSRNGKFCDLCLVKPSSAIRFGCYRNSRIATIPFFIARILRIQEKYLGRFQKVIVPSQRALRIFTSFGITNSKWQVIPHSINSSKVVIQDKTEKFVFIGRLTAEKGIEAILDSWPSDFFLDVIGDGDLDKSRYLDREAINFLGRIPREEVIRSVSSYKAMIFSSSAPESALPLVALECLAFGLPIISVDHNTVADAIRAGGFGLVLPSKFTESDLASSLEFVKKNYKYLSENAENYSRDNHNYDSWVLKYKSVYSEVIEEWKFARSLEV